MIRVLHVLGELRSSGAEVMLCAVGGLWDDHGIKCDIVSIGKQPGPYAEVLTGAGYGVHHIPFTGDIGFLRAYAKLIRTGRYDIVHVHTERASVYLSVTGRLVGARVARTVHNSFPFEGGLARRRKLQRWLARVSGTRFIAIGQTVAENEFERFSNPTSIIENWIRITHFVPPSADERILARKHHGIPDDAIAIVTVGNCSEVKNHNSLLVALSKLADVPWVWLHVGEEDARSTERLLATSLDVSQWCRFLGRVDPLLALHAADLFVMPSLYEGIGMATVEAIATGLPVVLTDVPGNRDLLGLSESTVWSTVDAEGLLIGLRRAMADDGLRVGQSQRQKQHAAVQVRFSPEAGARNYSGLYSSLLAARGVG